MSLTVDLSRLPRYLFVWRGARVHREYLPWVWLILISGQNSPRGLGRGRAGEADQPFEGHQSELSTMELASTYQNNKPRFAGFKIDNVAPPHWPLLLSSFVKQNTPEVAGEISQSYNGSKVISSTDAPALERIPHG